MKVLLLSTISFKVNNIGDTDIALNCYTETIDACRKISYQMYEIRTNKKIKLQ